MGVWFWCAKGRDIPHGCGGSRCCAQEGRTDMRRGDSGGLWVPATRGAALRGGEAVERRCAREDCSRGIFRQRRGGGSARRPQWSRVGASRTDGSEPHRPHATGGKAGVSSRRRAAISSMPAEYVPGKRVRGVRGPSPSPAAPGGSATPRARANRDPQYHGRGGDHGPGKRRDSDLHRSSPVGGAEVHNAVRRANDVPPANGNGKEGWVLVPDD